MSTYSHSQYPIWFKIYLYIKSIRRKPFIANKINLLLIGLSILVNVIIWLYLRMNLNFNVFEIVILSRAYEGPAVINTPDHALILPQIGLSILLINILLSLFFYKKDKVINYLILGAALLAQLVLLSSSISLVLANK